MKKIMTVIIGTAFAAVGCKPSASVPEYTVDKFADVKVIRYDVPGWDELSFQQKAYAYHLSEAAKWGRDIYWDQNCEHNLELRHALENILENYSGRRDCAEFDAFLDYAKRVFFANGIHHHYAEDKFYPECSEEYFAALLDDVSMSDSKDVLIPFVFGRDSFLQRRCTSAEVDIVEGSSVNFYEGVNRAEVEKYYASIMKKDDPCPVAYGLNTKVVKRNGKVVELPWKSGGIYGPAIDRICAELELAAQFAENDEQKKALGLLVEFYRTGDLRVWDEFNIQWLRDMTGTVDYVNGFIEDYNDPLGRKGAWEGHVNIKDAKASGRSKILSENAQWFEDNSPVAPQFRKPCVKGVSAKVINAVCLMGDTYPATPIGINLPNADWIRRDHGSKSVTIANITEAYNLSALEQPTSVLGEFAFDRAEIEMDKKYGAYASDIHTDLHECLGHGSGQLLPGVSSTAMGEYSSTLEEARADLFGLYYSADPKLVELGIMPSADCYKAEYSSFIRNGIMVQFNRVEFGRQNTEAHMQDRQLIAQWCYENGLGKGAKGVDVIERVVRDGKTYFTVRDFEALRGLFAELLAEIQRIKSEGDFEAGKALVEKYAVNIDPQLHKEVLERYSALGLKPYGGFINPDIVPVCKDGEIVDYEVVCCTDFIAQQLEYGKKYRAL